MRLNQGNRDIDIGTHFLGDLHREGGLAFADFQPLLTDQTRTIFNADQGTTR